MRWCLAYWLMLLFLCASWSVKFFEVLASSFHSNNFGVPFVFHCWARVFSVYLELNYQSTYLVVSLEFWCFDTDHYLGIVQQDRHPLYIKVWIDFGSKIKSVMIPSPYLESLMFFHREWRNIDYFDSLGLKIFPSRVLVFSQCLLQ